MDIAIVGGGVAGCYSAYRLANANVGSIDIYEMSNRVGGRLWSVRLGGGDAAPIELGATFFSTLQRNVYGLVCDELRLPCSHVSWSRDRLFFRGMHLTDESFGDPLGVPFNLEGAEIARDGLGVLAYVLGRIAPGLAELWPFNGSAPNSPSETNAYLRSLQHNGRALWECSFWNVLSDVASNEAYQLLTCAIGSISVFRNANALDSVWSLLQELAPQDFYRIDSGYQSLAQTLWDAPGDKLERHLRHRLTRLDRDGGRFVLSFDAPHGVTRRSASHVILALPQRALKHVAFGEGVFEDSRVFAQLRDSVHAVPACKLFMTFDAPWWRIPACAANTIAASYTDLPMQQSYCFGGGEGERATLMASLADDVSVSFWRTLSAKDLPSYRNPVRGAPPELRCSVAMVESARRQLALLHGAESTPLPLGALFINWEREPFGAGWHAWSAGVQSSKARKQIRTPAKDLYVCGEAYAERQGWVEGALNSAEMVVQHLGVDRPSWVDRSYVFEQEEGECYDKSGFRISRRAWRKRSIEAPL